MLATLSLAIIIVGWILFFVGLTMKFSYDRKKDELKRKVSIFCFFTALGLFLLSIVISLVLI